ncbi:DUF5615 family PIN-like protein [Candidatus Thiosymbion oneisti]
MRLLANENIPLASVSALREAGHDVGSVSERSPGISVSYGAPAGSNRA